MMTHEESIEFLATYALDAVEREEREAVEEHLAECPRCRAELDAFREVTTALGNSVEPLPEGLWTTIASRLPGRDDEERPPMPRLMRSEADEADEADADETDGADRGEGALARLRARENAPGRGRFATVAAIVVAAAAVVTVLSVSLVHANDQVSQLQRSLGAGTPPGAVVAALETPGHKVVNMEGTDHVRVAQFVIADGRGYLVTSTLQALSADHTYQLWAVINGHAISLGLMGQRPDQATFTLAGSPSVSKLAITVEPSGGAVLPTRPMVAQGTV
jgi:anti-sigma-K factor RskA